MNQVSTVGLDLAKYIFQLHGADSAGAVVFRKKLRRGQLLAFLATLPPCTVAMEACASAHYGRVAKFLHLPRVEPAGGICASEPEVADDPERPCREAEAPVEGRFQGPALRGSADPAGRLVVPALPAQLP